MKGNRSPEKSITPLVKETLALEDQYRLIEYR